ncbi:MAG TPA: hypothetical protein VMU05_16170 [Dongiaceae bacterium]|nr:hypothetical protein [Dongiaceae bacterium]
MESAPAQQVSEAQDAPQPQVQPVSPPLEPQASLARQATLQPHLSWEESQLRKVEKA